LLLGAGLALSVLPFLTHFIIADNFTSFRVLYGGLVLPCGLLAMSMSLRELPWVQRAGATLAFLYALLSIPVSWKDNLEFIDNYNRDRHLYAELEAFAHENGTNQVLFMDQALYPFHFHNPYNYEIYRYHAAKIPIMRSNHWNWRFLTYYTDLNYAPWHWWEGMRTYYGHLGYSLPRDEPYEFYFDPEGPIVVVVPR
jgi:hypothetical protein